jgi:hypothetical protein
MLQLLESFNFSGTVRNKINTFSPFKKTIKLKICQRETMHEAFLLTDNKFQPVFPLPVAR